MITWYTCRSSYGHHLSVRAASAFAAIALAEDLVGLSDRMTYTRCSLSWSVIPINFVAPPPPVDCSAKVHLSCTDCEPFGGGEEYACDYLAGHKPPHRCGLALGTQFGHIEWADKTQPEED